MFYIALQCEWRNFINFFSDCSESISNFKINEKMLWEPLAVQGFLECRSKCLSLYRGFLWAAHSKSAEDRHKIESIGLAEFCCNSKQVDQKNILYIMYLFLRDKKQLDQLKSPDLIGLSSLNASVFETINPKPWTKTFI